MIVAWAVTVLGNISVTDGAVFDVLPANRRFCIGPLYKKARDSGEYS